MLSNTTSELTFTGASPPISESAQIATETCLHPNVLVIFDVCPSDDSLAGYVANMIVLYNLWNQGERGQLWRHFR